MYNEYKELVKIWMNRKKELRAQLRKQKADQPKPTKPAELKDSRPKCTCYLSESCKAEIRARNRSLTAIDFFTVSDLPTMDYAAPQLPKEIEPLDFLASFPSSPPLNPFPVSVFLWSTQALLD